MGPSLSDMRLAGWKSEGGRDAYVRAYDEAMALWPVPYESALIPTRFGTTHAVISGPEDAPPLLLLPAAIGTGALQWYPNAARLTTAHRLIALDFVAAPGKGAQTAALVDRTDYTRWLLDLLDALDIEQADVVASSQGGWMALNLAIEEPARTRAVAALAPAASLLPFHKPIEWMIRVGPWMPVWTAGPSITANLATDFEPDDRFVRVAELGLRHFRYQQGALIPSGYTDSDLRSIRCRLLVMVGDHERIYDPQAALQRAAQLIPGVETELVADAGHLINMDQAEYADARVIEFLQGAA